MITSKILGLWSLNRTLLLSDAIARRWCAFKGQEMCNTRFFVSMVCLTNHPKKKFLTSRQSEANVRNHSLKFDPEQQEEDEEQENQNSDEILSEEILKEVAKGDPQIEKLLKVFEFEISIYREQQLPMPKAIKPREWMELVKLPSVFQRKKYLEFLGKNEIERDKKIRQNIEARALREIIKEFVPLQEGLRYGLGLNSLLVRVFDRNLNKLLSDRMLGAMMFHPPIIFDCSYDSYMSRVNAKYCAKQIHSSYVCNRLHTTPVHLKCCNVNKNGVTYEFLEKLVLKEIEGTYLMDIHEESYLDLYPKKQLVYLTPHTNNELQKFDPTKIYIIGAFVDKGTGVQASLAKAKAEGLEMAKFPLDRYLIWKSGGKSLPLNTVLHILLDLRLYQKWEVAFKNIPERNLKMSKLQELFESSKRVYKRKK